MSDHKLSRIEKETTITFNESENYARVETYNKRLNRRIAKLCETYADFIVIGQGEKFGEYLVPKKYIQISKPRRQSTEQKIKVAYHGKLALKRYWEKQNLSKNR